MQPSRKILQPLLIQHFCLMICSRYAITYAPSIVQGKHRLETAHSLELVISTAKYIGLLVLARHDNMQEMMDHEKFLNIFVTYNNFPTKINLLQK